MIEGIVTGVTPNMSKSQAKKLRTQVGYEITLVGKDPFAEILEKEAKSALFPRPVSGDRTFVLKTDLMGSYINRRVKEGDYLVVSGYLKPVNRSTYEVTDIRGMDRFDSETGERKPFGDEHLYQWLYGKGVPVGESAEDVASFESYNTGIDRGPKHLKEARKYLNRQKEAD